MTQLYELDVFLIIGLLAGTAGTCLYLWLRYLSEPAYKKRVVSALLQLGLRENALSELAACKLGTECEAMYAVLGWRANSYRLAARFFTWYVTEYPFPETSAFVRSGCVVDSIEIMAEWAKAQPKLKDFLREEIHRVVTVVYQGAENAGMDKRTEILVQLGLLERWKRASE
jgi:hypothetical protein